MNQTSKYSTKIIKAAVNHLDLAAPLFDAYRVFYKQPSDLSGAKEYLYHRITREEALVFLAVTEKDKQMIGLGFVQLYPSFSSITMKREWILYDLFVSPAARKQGIGRALMDKARQLAIETGAQTLILSTAKDNYPAQHLYESLGYERDEEFYVYELEI